MSTIRRPKSPAKLISRYDDFQEVQAARPDFEEYSFHRTKVKVPGWKVGDGANSDEWKDKKTVSIDPHAADRNPLDNYKLLVSGIVPRPIGVISTQGKDGKRNLAPFSYLQIVNHDPPIFTIGFTAGVGTLKDTPRHILETGECVINVISEHFVEAANYTAIDAPPGVSEWALSGLTQADSAKVAPPRVAEAIFSVEGKLIHTHDWFSPSTGKNSGMLAIVEGVYFHVREDALNEDQNVIDATVLRPVSRLGGITYARSTVGYEVMRPSYTKDRETDEWKKVVGNNTEASPEEQ